MIRKAIDRINGHYTFIYSHIYIDKGILFGIYKQLLQLNIKNTKLKSNF